MTAPLISVRDLTRRYPGVLAMDGVSLDIGRGEIIGLVGKNGAGKSTLIKVLAGLERPDEGTMEIDGAPFPEPYGPRAAHALGLAFMHQELANVNALSVAENVALGGAMPRRGGLFIDWARLAREARDVMGRLDPAIDVRRPVGDLTMVEQRMVMIGRALRHDARLLVLDEPSTSLTDTEIGQLHSVVRELRGEGRTVIYISHRLREIVELTDRIVVMQDGSVSMVGATADVTEGAIVRAIAGEGAAKPRQAAGPVRAGERPVILRARGLANPPTVTDASLEIRAGEVLGIAGLVGAGRTELVRMLCGADRPTAGSIELDGRPVRFASPRDATRRGIGLLPEDRRHQGLVLGMNVRENVTLGALGPFRRPGTGFVSTGREARAVEALIGSLAIKTPGTEQIVRRLSGGNQQKVVLARWLARDNRILIFDEPTQGVDVHAKDEMFALIREVVSAGRAAVLISSDFSELVALSDRVVVMREGATVGEIDGPDISEPAILNLVYSHPPGATQAPARPSTRIDQLGASS